MPGQHLCTAADPAAPGTGRGNLRPLSPTPTPAPHLSRVESLGRSSSSSSPPSLWKCTSVLADKAGEGGQYRVQMLNSADALARAHPLSSAGPNHLCRASLEIAHKLLVLRQHLQGHGAGAVAAAQPLLAHRRRVHLGQGEGGGGAEGLEARAGGGRQRVCCRSTASVTPACRSHQAVL